MGQYTYELARRLAADPRIDPDFFYALGWSRQVREAPVPGGGKVFPLLRRRVPHAYILSRFAQGLRFSLHARRGRFDLYHEPNFLAHRFNGPTVTTVHDLSWIRFPEAHPEERVRAMHRFFEPGLRRSSLILTDSQFVKQEVIDVFGIDPGRILAIPLGVNPAFHPRGAHETAALLQSQELIHGNYLLAVGTLEPRKNLVTALRAYAGLPESAQRAYPMVLAGLKGWHTSALEREMAPLVAKGRLRVTGYLTREDLATLVAGATGLVYPSIYEGFGLPPLEAMACGVPTIVSNVASLPEVVADTGLLIEPHDVEGLREAMLRLIESPELRADLAARALARAGQFSWDQCANETVAAYRLALARAA